MGFIDPDLEPFERPHRYPRHDILGVSELPEIRAGAVENTDSVVELDRADEPAGELNPEIPAAVEQVLDDDGIALPPLGHPQLSRGSELQAAERFLELPDPNLQVPGGREVDIRVLQHGCAELDVVELPDLELGGQPLLGLPDELEPGASDEKPILDIVALGKGFQLPPNVNPCLDLDLLLLFLLFRRHCLSFATRVRRFCQIRSLFFQQTSLWWRGAGQRCLASGGRGRFGRSLL
jgi:hypothetical protein